MTTYTEQYKKYSQLVEEALQSCIPEGNCAQKNVEDAMRYSLLGGGKRLRGVLVLAFNELCGGKLNEALPFACAIEMVHAYSLIHDDLPCMDNDVLRRGKPTCHIRYGEAIALLAGDGLLTKAFEMICEAPSLSDHCRCKATATLAAAAGTKGMIGGQVIDIESEGSNISTPLLDTLHSLKTGALIRAAAALGCISANADATVAAGADHFAAILGLIFQIVDDILDVTSSTEELGKSIGSDAENGKMTYATLYGIDGSKRIVSELTPQAKAALSIVQADNSFLCSLVDSMAVRTK